MAAVMAVFSWPVASRARTVETWTSGLVVVSALVFLFVFGSPALTVGWLVLAAIVVLLVLTLRSPRWGRPDAADAAAAVGWAVAIAAIPRLIEVEHGGWLAPLLLLLASRRLAAAVFDRRLATSFDLIAPTRDVRGTLSVQDLVAGGDEGIPQTSPIDLELRAGESLAILCDVASERALLADVLSGRSSPVSGEVAVDGVPVEGDDSLVAVVGPGESLLPGGISDNLGALCADPPSPEALTAAWEACALDEVKHALGDGVMAADGSPLEVYHRMLLITARVLPSHYRVLVVVDPVPWVNAVRAERWRSAVVRASVGRTAVWLTPDRDLASRAGQIFEFRQGSLRRIDTVG
jgi:ABC-type transport system involved in cytochrome bd biosynthesis fused ATPase/permease subunit